MNFHKFLRFNLIFFKLCGFYPYQIVRTIHCTINKSVIWTVTICNLLSVTLQTALVFYDYEVVFERPILLGKIVDMFKYGYLAVTCLTILIESIVTVDEQTSFLLTSRDVQDSFRRILPPSSAASQNRIYKKNLLKTYAITVAFILVQIYLGLRRYCPFCNWYTMLAFYAFNKYLHYIMYVDIIHQQADNLVCELDQIIEISATQTSNKMSEAEKLAMELVLVGKLKMASSLYVRLYDMSVAVNSAFGWSLIINLVHSYIQIFVDFFWMFQLIENGLAAYFVECLISMLPSLLIIGLVFYTTTDCLNKAHQATTKVHKIKANRNSSRLSTLIHYFILQTQHLPIILEAKGFFSMDFVPLKDMIGSITTFMVFIIQSTDSAKFNSKGFMGRN